MSDPQPSAATPQGGSPVGLIAANLRAERLRTGLSISAVAREAGVSKSTLSQLETGQGNPSVETLWAIAVALGVPFSRLVASPRNPMRVVRVAERAGIEAEESNYTAALLAPGSHERRDLYVVNLEPGTPRHSAPHLRGSVEHVVVSAGSLRVGPEGKLVELTVGDYAAFAGDVAHSYEALEPGTWIVLMMEHPTP